MFVYHPNSVEIENDSPLQRVIPYPSTVTSYDRSKEDLKTIFYDVFIDPATRKLHCLGPTLYNLKRELFPLKVFVEGRPVGMSYYQIERLFFLESRPIEGRLPDSLTIEFKFRKFSRKIRISHLEQDDDINSGETHPISISTLQKDNEIEWISDWILWHRRLYGVTRVVLYDNGSDNRDQLLEFLPTLESEVSIIFVHWPYPYGIRPLKSAQHGALNHGRIKFPVRGGYCVNLDIDEYLVKSEKETLLAYLNRVLKHPYPGVVRCKPRTVPNSVLTRANQAVRCFDFTHVFSVSGDDVYFHRGVKTERWCKYIYRYGSTGYNAPHKTRSHKNKRFCNDEYSARHRVKMFCRRSFWKIGRLFRQPKVEKPKIDSITAPQSDLYYYHFSGLTTQWQGGIAIKSYTRLNDEEHSAEPAIQELAERAGLKG